MKNILIIGFLLIPVLANTQLAKISNDDTLCGRRISRDREGRILSWYKSGVPGAGYAQVAKLASEFLLSTCPKESQTGLPMYLVTCCFQGPHMTKDHNFIAEDWPHNPACVFAGCVQSLAVQYRVYTGDESYLELVRLMLDYQLANGTTPSDFKWPNVPYASSDAFSKIYQGATKYEADGDRGDGLHCIEPDKVGELGYGYLRFFEITGDKKYLEASIHCADALTKETRNVIHENSPFIAANTQKSPWPWRVNARTGVIVSEYCSNVLDPIRLFDELLRVKSRIGLDTIKAARYKSAREAAWNWLFSRNGPMKTCIWNNYFEDIPNDPDQTNRLQITPMETAKYLILHPMFDKNIDIDVPALIYWVNSAFKSDRWDAINEQTWCYEPMGSHTSRYGATCAMYYERSKNPWYKDQAYRFLNVATYMTYDNGVVAVGPNWPGSWFSDGYSDYIRHFMDAMASIPEWAPAGEDHLLRSSSVVQKITYGSSEIQYSTFDEKSEEILRLAAKPKSVSTVGAKFKETRAAGQEGWSWEPLSTGGVLRIMHVAGNQLVIKK